MPQPLAGLFTLATRSLALLILRQALEAASFQQFQVALLDASLPEMDGLELMHRLKRTQDGVQVVILSGCEYPIWRAKAEGVFAWLLKPCALALNRSDRPACVRLCDRRPSGAAQPGIIEDVPVTN